MNDEDKYRKKIIREGRRAENTQGENDSSEEDSGSGCLTTLIVLVSF